MNFPTAKTAGYDTAGLLRARARVWRRGAFKGAVAIIATGVVAATCVDYLARLPRERSDAKRSYWDRVGLGANFAWTALTGSLTAPSENIPKSKLPVAEIYLPGAKLDALNRALPKSGREFQTGLVRIDGKVHKAKLRYRGDSINHWSFPQKSWRVRLSRGKFVRGMSELNLYLPRTPDQVSDVIGYEFARRMGLQLVPEANFVQLRLNRRFDGTRVLLEQVTQNFLSVRERVPGKIFVGDASTEQIYDAGRRPHLFKDASVWEVDQPRIDRGSADSRDFDVLEIKPLIEALNAPLTTSELKHRLEQVIDVQETLRYMALLSIVGSVHIDDTHNQKWYLDPERGRLVPIVWDTAAFMWPKNKKVDTDSNLLFRKLLTIPEYREQKNRYILEALDGPLELTKVERFIDETAEKLKSDVLANPLKLKAMNGRVSLVTNQEWSESVEGLKSIIRDRFQHLRARLNDAKISYSISTEDNQSVVVVSTTAHAPTQIEGLLLKFGRHHAGEKVQVKGQNWHEEAVVDGEGNLTVPLKREFSADRGLNQEGKKLEVVAGTYELSISAPVKEVEFLQPTNSFTGSRAEVKRVDSLERGSTAPNQAEETKIFSGEVEVRGDLLLTGDVEIKPGTTFRMKQGASIVIASGRVKAVGTKESPIIIEGLDALPWGVVALTEGTEAQLRYVRIKRGSYDLVQGAHYQAPLSVHNSHVTISDSEFSDSTISAVHSDVTLSRVHLSGVAKHFIQEKASKITTNDVVIDEDQPVLKSSLADRDAAGTLPRSEREFKYGVKGRELDFQSFAIKISEALKEATRTTEGWHAPAYTHTNFWPSEVTGEEPAYLDIYFDTDDGVNAKHGISYRLRYRFNSIKSHNNYLRYPDRAEFWPYRVEFQAKTGRVAKADGFAAVDEARFEFRRQSKPFGAERLPPPSPWALEEYIHHAQTGTFKGIVTTPGKSVASYLRGFYPERGEYLMKPKTVVLTRRNRQHLNIQSPWGSGPNPEQSYIITLDDAHYYSFEDYISVVRSQGKATKELIPVGKALEIEVEFERNVSDKLDKEIEAAAREGRSDERAKLEEAREAFFKDQVRIMEVIRDRARRDELDIVPVVESKFAQSSKASR